MTVYGPPSISPGSRYGAGTTAIDLAGFEELKAAWEQAPDVVRSELLAAMTEADDLLRREIAESAPKATGHLRSGILAQETVSDQDVIGMVYSAGANYAIPAELGTRPHFIGKSGIDSLMDWVLAKLHVSDEKTARSIAFAIAKNIAKRGTIGAHMFERGFSYNKDQVLRMFDDALDRIATRLGAGYYGA